MAAHRFHSPDRDDSLEKQEKAEIAQSRKRKFISLFEGSSNYIDFKDYRLLSRFVTERGKILPRRITGLNAQQQKKISRAIKRARQMSILPFASLMERN